MRTRFCWHIVEGPFYARFENASSTERRDLSAQHHAVKIVPGKLQYVLVQRCQKTGERQNTRPSVQLTSDLQERTTASACDLQARKRCPKSHKSTRNTNLESLLCASHSCPVAELLDPIVPLMNLVPRVTELYLNKSHPESLCTCISLIHTHVSTLSDFGANCRKVSNSFPTSHESQPPCLQLFARRRRKIS